MPKLELHAHLNGSIRNSTLLYALFASTQIYFLSLALFCVSFLDSYMLGSFIVYMGKAKLLFIWLYFLISPERIGKYLLLSIIVPG